MSNLKVLRFRWTNSRRSFYRAANAIFGRVGRIASEEVVLHLMLTKCISILLHGLEACPMRKTYLNSLDFVVNRLFMKLFQTGNIDLFIMLLFGTIVSLFSHCRLFSMHDLVKSLLSLFFFLLVVPFVVNKVEYNNINTLCIAPASHSNGPIYNTSDVFG